MKYFPIIFLFFAACSNQPQPVYQHEVGYSNGQPSTVVVQTDNGSSILMNYMLWRSLMDQGGPTVVNNYYNTHRSDPEFQPERQSEYRRNYDSSVKKVESVQTKSSQGFGKRDVTTSQSNGFGRKTVDTKSSSGFGTYTPKTTNPYSNTSSNSVSTNRSSGFGSSPSKSFSSPSKTTTSKSGGFGRKN